MYAINYRNCINISNDFINENYAYDDTFQNEIKLYKILLYEKYEPKERNLKLISSKKFAINNENIKDMLLLFLKLMKTLCKKLKNMRVFYENYSTDILNLYLIASNNFQKISEINNITEMNRDDKLKEMREIIKVIITNIEQYEQTYYLLTSSNKVYSLNDKSINKILYFRIPPFIITIIMWLATLYSLVYLYTEGVFYISIIYILLEFITIFINYCVVTFEYTNTQMDYDDDNNFNSLYITNRRIKICKRDFTDCETNFENLLKINKLYDQYTILDISIYRGNYCLIEYFCVIMYSFGLIKHNFSTKKYKDFIN